MSFSICHYVILSLKNTCYFCPHVTLSSKRPTCYFCLHITLSSKPPHLLLLSYSLTLSSIPCLYPSLCYSVLKTTPSVTPVLLCYPVFLTLSPLSSVILSFKRKQEEKKAASLFLRMGNFNERQAQIIKLFADEPTAMVTIKDLEVKFGVSPTTAKSDIIGLLGENIVSEISLNKVKRAYIKGDGLDELLSKV